MVRFPVTVECDHSGCQRSTSGDCQVEPGEFMARGVFDLRLVEDEWAQYLSRHYCPEHRAEAGERRQ